MPRGSRTILQLTHQGGPAGSTQSIFDLGQHLARRGHRVLVGCRADVLLARLARDAGLPVVPLSFLPRGVLARALEDLLARERVDVVNSHATLDRRALTWMRWRGRLPQAFVVTRRTMPRTSPVELLPVGLTADRTIAVSEAVARALRRRLHPGARLRVVPNGIALERVDAPPPPADLAAARAALGDPGGRPVVASDAGGNPEMVRSGETGLLVRPLDPAAWAEALERLLGDGALARRLAHAGRALVRREFTLERTAERTEAVYREALARRAPGRLLAAAAPR